MDIYLFLGQSNMAGFAPIGALDTVTLNNVYLFNDDNQWEKAKNTSKEGFNRYSSVRSKTHRLSVSYTFARKIAAYTNREIGVVSNARGSTQIDQWQKSYNGDKDFNLYEEAIRRTKLALESKPGAKIKGIIWHQGESDNAKERSERYMVCLKKLVSDLRADLGDERIVFIAGELGKWNNRGLAVNPVIRQIKDNIPYSDWVSSDGLSSLNLENNDPHFDTFSQRVFGGRYADKAIELIYNLPVASVSLYTDVDYRGRSVMLRAGDYSSKELESMGIGSNEVRSIEIPTGFEVTLIFNGLTREIRNDTNDVEFPNLTSLEIRNMKNK